MYFLRSPGLAEEPPAAPPEDGQETMLSSPRSPPRQLTR